MTIRFFSKSDRYREFSNFANYPVLIDGHVWPTTEHYYQAQKFEDPARQEDIRQLSKAVAAKRYAQKYRATVRADWAARKDGVMERALRAKFTQHETLRALWSGAATRRSRKTRRTTPIGARAPTGGGRTNSARC
nr:NADAR family protein [Methyloceanibacter marginalis]